MKIWVVAWNWYDNSGFGIIKAFANELDANRFADEIKQVSDRQITVLESYVDAQALREASGV